MKKIVLLGDSIRLIGYGTRIQEFLGEDYEIWQPEDNCRYSFYTLRLLRDFSKEIQGADVIHWNNGLWDICDWYGDGTLVPLDMYVATIPVGYGDGYPRSLSNKGYVLIRGKKAPVLGRICMDQFMVDVSHIPEAAEGDLVTLIGHDGEEYISAELLGELSGRFNYELVCDLSQRIPRVYVKNGEPVGIQEGSHI